MKRQFPINRFHSSSSQRAWHIAGWLLLFCVGLGSIKALFPSRIRHSSETIRAVMYTAQAGSTLLVIPPEATTADQELGLIPLPVMLPEHGTLNLNSNGGLNYTPNSNFIGVDSFRFQALARRHNSWTTTVAIVVTPAGRLFFDDFSRPANVISPLPWVPILGKWTIHSGTFHGGSVHEFADAYVAGNWTNFTVQSRIRFPATAFGGGLGGRVNAATGAKYVVNVYPFGRFDAPGKGPVARLLKFHDWTTLGRAPMKEVSLPPVGTNWHTLRLTFDENNIRVHFDDLPVMDVRDNGFDGLPPFRSGGIATHSFTDTVPFLVAFDDVQVW